MRQHRLTAIEAEGPIWYCMFGFKNLSELGSLHHPHLVGDVRTEAFSPEDCSDASLIWKLEEAGVGTTLELCGVCEGQI